MQDDQGRKRENKKPGQFVQAKKVKQLYPLVEFCFKATLV